MKHLLGLGAQDVIHPELEGGLQVVRHTLLRLGFPLREVQKYGDIVRRESYDVAVNSDEEHRALLGLLEAARSLEISWVKLGEDSRFAGEKLAKVGLAGPDGGLGGGHPPGRRAHSQSRSRPDSSRRETASGSSARPSRWTPPRGRCARRAKGPRSPPSLRMAGCAS